MVRDLQGSFPLAFLLIGWVGGESASLKPFCKDLVLRADENHLLAYFLPIISYMQLPGAPLAPGSAPFLVQGLFLQPAPGASVTLRALRREQGGMPSLFRFLRWRKASALHWAVGSGIACPVGTWSQTLIVGFAASTWCNGTESLGRGLARADTPPEGPVQVVHISLSKLDKRRGTVP